jgi:hypothetical protein
MTLKYELRKNCSRNDVATWNIFNLICSSKQIFIWIYLNKLFRQHVVSSHTRQIHVKRSSLLITPLYLNHRSLFSVIYKPVLISSLRRLAFIYLMIFLNLKGRRTHEWMWWIKDVEESDYGLFYCTFPEFTRRDWEKALYSTIRIRVTW